MCIGETSSAAPAQLSRLEDLALNAVATVLKCTIRRINDMPNLPRTSPIADIQIQLRSNIPASLRQRLLDLGLKCERIYNPIDLMMFEVLLSSDIKRLTVKFVRKWYQDIFLEILGKQGSGLMTLRLEDFRLPYRKFSTAFSALASLTVLILKYTCDDLTLWHIGHGCPSLQKLDVFGCKQVTDLGVKALCIKDIPEPQTEEASSGKEEKSSWISNQQSFWENLTCCCSRAPVGIAVVGLSWWRASLMRISRKNACCTTLLVINVQSTSVSHDAGLPLLKNSCPNAKVLIGLGVDNM
ncbi:uncharacterized protein LOC135948253 [Cloeon dipterum]|uniref:uncharacterized protein LOC135948253 n=1 Tax=Cloeon dipterum TaxID=197152 RepID=UPI00321F7977